MGDDTTGRAETADDQLAMRHGVCLFLVGCLLSCGCVRSTLHLRIDTPFVRWADTRMTTVWLTLPAQHPGAYAVVSVEDAMTLRDSVVALTTTVQQLSWRIPVRTSGSIRIRIEIYDDHNRCLETRIGELWVP